MKTIQCPSCGAAATNMKNCEFCGSLFVRYPDLNISSNNLISDKGQFNGFIFPGLKDQLQKNLSSQNELNFFVTEVVMENQVLIQVVASNRVGDLLKLETPSYPGLSVHMPFTPEENYRYKKFIKLEESKLFTHSYSEELKCHDYIIDFGNDALGAAYLVSKILTEVDGVSTDTLLHYETKNFSSESLSGNKKGNCFIATATMGSYDHPMVVELRGFRDNWILKKSWGDKFVNWYYKYGAVVAKLIDKSILVKQICYLLIVKPLVIFSRCITVFKK